MTDEEIRLECLRIAAASERDADKALSAAREMAAWVAPSTSVAFPTRRGGTVGKS